MKVKKWRAGFLKKRNRYTIGKTNQEKRRPKLKKLDMQKILQR